MIKVHVLVHLKSDVLDAPGQAIRGAVAAAGYPEVAGVRVGKSLLLEIDAPTIESARPQIDRLCRDILSNPLMEDVRWEVVK